MVRIFALLVACLAALAFASDGSGPVSGALTLGDIRDARAMLMEMATSPDVVVNASCCRMCSKGKACGNSCISRDKQCHKGVGCACDE